MLKSTYIYIAFLIIPLQSLGQTKIEILSADELIYDQQLGEYQLCRGNVKFKQGNLYMDCDSARFYDQVNKIEAFGNIDIVQQDTLDLHGEYLVYDGDTRLAQISDQVMLSDGTMTLTTDQLNYNMDSKVGYYTTGGQIVNDRDRLYSVRGTYFSRRKDIYFSDSVRLKNPDYIMESDTLEYNTVQKLATFRGPTYIISEENTIFCRYGWYNTDKESSQFSQGAYIEGENNRLLADSMVYFRRTGMGEAFGNLYFTDTSEQFSLMGQYGKYQRLKKETLITGQPMAIKNMNGDSLYLRADTFVDYADTFQHKKRWVSAFSNVRLYKADIQAYADSLAYNFTDSTIGFYEDPILWSDSNQITGDTIIIFTRRSGIDYIDVLEKGLVIEKDVNGLYNQISGRTLQAFFRNGKLHTIDVYGNAQSIYYALEDGIQYSGVNEVFCGSMKISVDSNKVRTIKFMSQPKSIFYPLEDFPETKSRVPGFTWRAALKPRKQQFIK